MPKKVTQFKQQTFREAFFQSYGYWTPRQRRKKWQRFMKFLNRKEERSGL